MFLASDITFDSLEDARNGKEEKIFLETKNKEVMSAKGEIQYKIREQEVSAISRTMKSMAKELNIPVIALCQPNRKADERLNGEPQLSDLRESGAIEQDADIVCFIYKDEDKKEYRLKIAKHCNGLRGKSQFILIQKR